MKLESLENGEVLSSQSDERFLMRTAILANARRRGAALCPSKSEDPASLRRGNFTYFPVVPGRLEFAIEVRAAFCAQRPQMVAVELPGALEDVYLQALARLPEMSVILYPGPAGRRATRIYVPVEPADPFTEALRTAEEIGAEVIFSSPIRAIARICPTLIPTPTRSAASA